MIEWLIENILLPLGLACGFLIIATVLWAILK